MSARLLDHAYIVSTIVFTVYSQLVMRWQVSLAGPLPGDTAGKLAYVGHLLLSPWVLTGIFATFLAGVSWMLAMTKFEVSYAFPYVSLNYVLVLAASVLLFQESITGAKLAGTLLVVAGVVVIARG